MRFIRKTLLITVLLAALIVGALAEGASISSFDTTVTVAADNSYAISETIIASFTDAGVGITRTLPLLAPSGRKAAIRRVSCNSKCRKRKTKNALVVRLGDKKSTALSEAYCLNYTYDVGYDFDEEKDTFRVNLADADMGVPVESFTFTISMPAGFDARKLKFISGYYGVLGEDKVTYTISGNVITGSIVGGLMAYESIDVEAELDNGYFADAVYKNAVGDFLQKIVPYLSLAICAAALFVLFTRCKNVSFVTEPKGDVSGRLNPPEMLYMINGAVTAEQMTSLIPYWAVCGLLAFQTDGRSVSLLLTGSADDSWPEYEKNLFQSLFSSGRTVSLQVSRRELIRAVNQAKRGLSDYWSHGKNQIFRPQNKLFPRLATLLPLAACALSSIGCGNSIYRARMSIILVILLFTLFSVVFWAAMLLTGWLAKRQGSRVNLWGFFLGAAAALVTAGNLYVRDCALIPLAGLGVSMLTAFIAGMLMWDMTPRTRAGTAMLKESLNLRDFIKYSNDRTVKEAAGDSPEMYFYALLPYAGVFGLESAWSERFNSIRLPVPQWFEMTTDSPVTPLMFTTRLEERMRVVKRAMAGADSDAALTWVYARTALRNVSRRVRAAGEAAYEWTEKKITAVQKFLRKHRKDDV